mmetsp:Transcript_41565/g.81226  ORF Transcript_41565/g.81226 Transcript_41565/m.81226 type:complete len:187 (-) Transcript_41565:41-601(-)
MARLTLAVLALCCLGMAAGEMAMGCSGALRLRGGYEDDGGYNGGGGYGDGGGYGGRGGYRGRGRGGFRGRGRGRGRGPPPDGPIDELKLYVGGLNWDLDNGGLKEIFSKYGECECEIMIDRYSQRSRGFGFVTFQDAAAATAAKEAMDGQEILGRAVAVNNARQRVERTEAEMGGEGGGGGDAPME